MFVFPVNMISGSNVQVLRSEKILKLKTSLLQSYQSCLITVSMCSIKCYIVSNNSAVSPFVGVDGFDTQPQSLFGSSCS